MTTEPVGARERLTTMLGRLVAATSTKALASETGTTDRTDAIAMVMGWLQGDIADIEAAAARAEAPRLTEALEGLYYQDFQHRPQCILNQTGLRDQLAIASCDCGLSDALDAARAALAPDAPVDAP